jgi:hypothetical protein
LILPPRAVAPVEENRPWESRAYLRAMEKHQ